MFIYEVKIPETRETILNELKLNTNLSLYLTGSRFFSPNTKFSSDTDYDFFTSELDPSMEEYLCNLGFCPEFSAYKDDNTLVVYRHPYGIDIQIVRSG